MLLYELQSCYGFMKWLHYLDFYWRFYCLFSLYSFAYNLQSLLSEAPYSALLESLTVLGIISHYILS